ncbi:MAG: glycosyltransferase [Acidimicrobiales bacterium]|nr:glycosyltransferase [Acidimicrobiales bacterium]
MTSTPAGTPAGGPVGAPTTAAVTPGSRRDQQARVAERAGLDLVDLLAEPPEPTLFAGLDHHLLVAEQWVPWRRLDADRDGAGGAIAIASVAPLGDDRLAEVARRLDAPSVTNLITTDWDIEHVVLEEYRARIVAEATDGLAEHQGELSAAHPWRSRQLIGIGLIVVVTLGALLLWPNGTAIVALTATNLVFLAAAMFKVVVALCAPRHRRGDETPTAPRIPDEDLPLYTLLVPAYREAGITQQLIDNLGGIDYPTEKLQILLLLEEDDQDTIDAFRATAAPDGVHMILVPTSSPRTKPKACNVGLDFARGEFLAIYDAEDVPHLQQLRDVVAQFRASGDEVACIQCRLNYHNAEENLLTRMFTLEYSFWFTYMLRGLDRLHLPIPLGGSSNHFRTEVLRELGGWDPHNVTEDADLGLRATALGYKVAANPSTTMEEACSRTGPWIRQRTRWIKGYMVTYLVHSRHPVRFTRATGLRGTLCLLLLVLGTPALYLASSVVWAFWLFTFLGGSVSWLHIPPTLQTLNLVAFALGFGSMIAVHAIAGRQRQRGLAVYALLLPLYWLLHSYASWRAIWHLVAKPDLWEKTPHGLVAAAPGQRSSASSR